MARDVTEQQEEMQNRGRGAERRSGSVGGGEGTGRQGAKEDEQRPEHEQYGDGGDAQLHSGDVFRIEQLGGLESMEFNHPSEQVPPTRYRSCTAGTACVPYMVHRGR